MSVNDEFLAYLKHGEFALFMDAWRNQIERYGRVGGTITISLNEQSREDIGGFLGKDYYNQKHAKITWKVVDKAIQHSRFEGADFMQVVNAYFQKEIISNKKQATIQQQALQCFLERIIKSYAHTKAEEWLLHVIQEDHHVMVRIRQLFSQQKEELEKHLWWAMKAMNALPFWTHTHANIAIFASSITYDPHAFDQGTLAYYFLLHSICYFLDIPHTNRKGMQKNDILFQAGLYQDSISNYCILAHINAYQHNSILHQGWDGFYHHYEAWNVNMQNLQNISGIDPQSCSQVIVVENPSVFQHLVNIAKRHQLTIGFVCTNGQLNYSGYLLMDLISNASIPLYYSGDMDPEGLLIADKLKQRYGDGLSLWHYTQKDFYIAKSKKFVSKKRMAMLELIQDEQLQAIGALLKTEPVGYQENLLAIYEMALLKM